MIFGFIVLLNSLARVADLAKCLLLNDEPCMVRRTIFDMNPVEPKHYPFMISLNKCSRSCNVLSPEIKHIYVTNKDEAKAVTEHAIVNAISIVQHRIQNEME